MRSYIILGMFIPFFAAMYYLGVIQDRMNRKVGGGMLSLYRTLRTLKTREFYMFVAVIMAMAAAIGCLIALDRLGYIDD